MAQLVLITKKQYREGINEIGDVVGVYPDDWKFSKKEQDDFNIVSVTGKKEDIKATVEISQVDGKEAWKDSDGNWKELKYPPKYILKYKDSKLGENITKYSQNTETTLSTNG